LALKIGCTLPLEEFRLGESIAVNGVCLTVTAFDRGWFEADVSHESLKATTLGDLQQGLRVHLERALAFGDRLGGHLVTGHVDGVGELLSTTRRGDGLDLQVRAPESVAPFLVPKGSVAVDGVSLTVNQPQADRFVVTLVPHTLAETLLGKRRVGDAFNLEGDILGKYVKHYLTGMQAPDSPADGGISEQFLADHGFGGGQKNEG
jgi:riboflavin synthase